MATITQQELIDALSYDPETGVFTRRKTGKKTGSVMVIGYVVICIYGKQFLAHRLAWLYIYGSLPDGIIDHINKDRADNRISNLRLATKAQNAFNSDKYRASSGMKGVYYQDNTDKWRVKLGNKHIGYFASKEEASLAWQAAAQKRAGEFYGGP